jgi:hypothetical protein
LEGGSSAPPFGRPNPHSRNKRYTIECNTSAEPDMKTLVWTRGNALPLDQVANRLKCPSCGNRNIHVFFEVGRVYQCC